MKGIRARIPGVDYKLGYELGNQFGYGAASCLRRDFLAPAQ